mmetsp:Transcript_8833/g.11103  ORF Transcript_8833/g.11103 Transcript_8833/m.11103 type:complete len:555 (+) Transcript_8833:56-1720(+)
MGRNNYIIKVKPISVSGIAVYDYKNCRAENIGNIGQVCCIIGLKKTKNCGEESKPSFPLRPTNNISSIVSSSKKGCTARWYTNSDSLTTQTKLDGKSLKVFEVAVRLVRGTEDIVIGIASLTFDGTLFETEIDVPIYNMFSTNAVEIAQRVQNRSFLSRFKKDSSANAMDGHIKSQLSTGLGQRSYFKYNDKSRSYALESGASMRIKLSCLPSNGTVDVPTVQRMIASQKIQALEVIQESINSGISKSTTSGVSKSTTSSTRSESTSMPSWERSHYYNDGNGTYYDNNSMISSMKNDRFGRYASASNDVSHPESESVAWSLSEGTTRSGDESTFDPSIFLIQNSRYSASGTEDISVFDSVSDTLDYSVDTEPTSVFNGVSSHSVDTFMTSPPFMQSPQYQQDMLLVKDTKSQNVSKRQPLVERFFQKNYNVSTPASKQSCRHRRNGKVNNNTPTSSSSRYTSKDQKSDTSCTNGDLSVYFSRDNYSGYDYDHDYDDDHSAQSYESSLGYSHMENATVASYLVQEDPSPVFRTIANLSNLVNNKMQCGGCREDGN